MIVNKNNNVITVILEAPWEKEVADWLWEQYGEYFLKNLLSRLLYEKQKVRVTVEVRKEVERRLGTNTGGNSGGVGTVRAGNDSERQGDSDTQS